ncbi:hypothetical protein U14_02317 [Candidatus Moduliflexus flocculans]|uniref:STAS/SEC14 domain-containing protein n=1 Tax=Candidatus Moduliflexus flocculans TaxID=1499966 RepID=A0A0S6VZE7_9BACT|nr:hypothetical protein U14_02317 [Candidatus Moduliflexus flocculans]
MMNDRVKIVQYKDCEILCADYTGLRGQEFLAVAEAHEALSMQSHSKELRHLIILTKAYLDANLRKHAAEMLERLAAKGFHIKTAAVGISGIQRIILNAVKKDMYAAKTLEDAQEWLAR